jgi:hypothetical protein
MKKNIWFYLLYAIGFIISAMACGGSPSIKNGKYMTPFKKAETSIDGSIMILDKAILVLVRDINQPNPTVLIPANDSLKEVVTCIYDERINSGCILSLKPWIELKGSYLRQDSIRQIFKFSSVKILDDAFSCSLIAEE